MSLLLSQLLDPLHLVLQADQLLNHRQDQGSNASTTANYGSNLSSATSGDTHTNDMRKLCQNFGSVPYKNICKWANLCDCAITVATAPTGSISSVNHSTTLCTAYITVQMATCIAFNAIYDNPAPTAVPTMSSELEDPTTTPTSGPLIQSPQLHCSQSDVS